MIILNLPFNKWSKDKQEIVRSKARTALAADDGATVRFMIDEHRAIAVRTKSDELIEAFVSRDI